MITIKANHYASQGITKAEGDTFGGEIRIWGKSTIAESVKSFTSVNAHKHAGSITLSTDTTGRICSSATHEAKGMLGGEICLDSHGIALPAAILRADKGRITLGREEKSSQSAIRINPFTQLQARRVRNHHPLLKDADCNLSAQVELLDPHAGTGSLFGNSVVALANGNIVVTKPGDATNGVDSGAFHLYNGQTAARISSAYGGQANDQVGLQGITPVNSNTNFVVRSMKWEMGQLDKLELLHGQMVVQDFQGL